MSDYQFNSRETYIAARKAWREDYAALAQEIRAQKRMMSETDWPQTYAYHGDYSAISREQMHDNYAMSDAQMKLHGLRVRANRMMKLRTAMTEEMRKQVAQSRETTPAVAVA